MSSQFDVSTPSLETWLTGGGELGQLIRDKDWSTTPLGPVDTWPQSLKTTLGILLHSRYPMFVFWGPQLIKIYNDAYRPITGHKHPWALGRPGDEVWPEIWSDIKPLVDRALGGDSTWSDDLMLFMERRGFPEEVYFTFSYSPISDESGGVGGMFCACTETTAEVLGERRLRTLRDLAAAPADARTVADACVLSARALEGNVADVPFALVYLVDENGAFRLRAHTGAIAGTPLAPLEIGVESHADVWSIGAAADTRVARHMSSLADRFGRVPAGPWPEPPNAAMVLPLVDRGLERGVGALVLGISSRRPFDADYREWFGLVAAQVSASISNARAAEEERKRAEALAELDRAKMAFFSNVSHEFRTPLTLLLGPLEDALSSRAALRGEALEAAHRNAQRLLKLVNSLLDFSRLEAGRTVLSSEPTDLGAMTEDLASVFRAAVEKAGLTFTVDCPPLEVMADVDRDVWEKVVLNLISNAFKHTFAGEIAVILRRVGDRAELRVRDTGTGIATEELAHVFERFHRVKETHARTHEGAGIGLALVKELVALHGGEVAVDSRPGRGSTFTVSVPLERPRASTEGARHGPALASSATAADAYVAEALRWLPSEAANSIEAHEGALLRSGVGERRPGARDARVVIADDNADMRDYVRRLLEPHWRVETVGDGEAALAAMRRDPPDLLLTDVMMPALDGFGLLSALRDDPSLRETPVILLSARAGEEARVEGLRAGADDYLVKPFGARELVARVGAAIELSRVRREAQERLSDVNRDLRHRVAELETLLSVIPVGIGIALDRECQSIHVNPAFAMTLGLPANANASLTAPPGERPTTFRVRDRDGNEIAPEQLPMQVAAREGREVRDIEFDIERDDGRVVRLLEYAVPLFDEKNQPRGSIGAFVDITERKKIEDDLQRTNRLKDEFLATLSHELRTPLNAVLGWTHMIRTGTLPKDMQKRAFDSIERNARAQAQLVDDLLDVSRIVSGKLQIVRDRVDLKEVLNLAIETIHPTAVNKGVKLTFVAGGRAPAIVTGDADRLRQVAWNLLSNAVKFTPLGGSVRVELTRDRSHAVIVVRDTGQGIDAEFLPYVFDRFRQADGTPARRHGGLGLGLALVRHLTEAHGGTATAASAGPNQGAVFTLRLPLAAASPRPAVQKGGDRRTAALLEQARILVVDDEADARELLRAILESEGATVDTTVSAGEALHRLQHEQFDLLLADLAMPHQDGLALIRALRALPGGPRDIPAIAVTAYTSLRERELALESGYGWHVPKPVDPEQLIASVAIAIRQADAAQSTTRAPRRSTRAPKPKRGGGRTTR